MAADGRFLSGIVSRYDAATGVREDGIDLLACALASGEGVVWAAGCPFVQRLSTGDGRLRKLAEVFLPFHAPATVENARVQFREMAVGAGSLWVLGDALDRRLWRLDARTGRVRATIPLGFPPTAVAVSAGKVWITDGLNDRVVPLDIRGAACSRRSAWVAARPTSRPAPAPSGSRTRSTARCRGSTRPRAGSSRRSTSAAPRAASRRTPGRSG